MEHIIIINYNSISYIVYSLFQKCSKSVPCSKPVPMFQMFQLFQILPAQNGIVPIWELHPPFSKAQKFTLNIVQIMKTEPTEKLAFYADCPDGTRNKLFTYRVHNLSHSTDLLNKFRAEGFTFRKAYHTFANGRNIPLDVVMDDITGDLSGIYAKTKHL